MLITSAGTRIPFDPSGRRSAQHEVRSENETDREQIAEDVHDGDAPATPSARALVAR
jgi:hypothetical protein